MTDRRQQGPVIINTHLETSELAAFLRKTKMKVRVSSSTPDYTLIFPVSGITFMVAPIKTAMLQSKDGYLIRPEWNERIHKWLAHHKICYLLVKLSTFDAEEMRAFNMLNMKFISEKVKIIYYNTDSEAVDGMIKAAEIMAKPAKEKVLEKMKSNLTLDMNNILANALSCACLNNHHIL